MIEPRRVTLYTVSEQEEFFRARELKAQLRAIQNIRLETERRFEKDIKCLRAANGEIKFLQNTFVHFPLWRRLWIALFPSRHFK